MDTTKPSSYSVSPAELATQLRGTAAPLIVDVRRNEAFAACAYLLPGALRRDPSQVAQWAATLPAVASVLVYCIHGHEVSQGTMTALRQRGINASYLQGGIEAWREQALPLVAKPVAGRDEKHTWKPA